MTDAPPLRLKWRKTWPDMENDFVGETPDSDTGFAGRISIKTFYQNSERREGWEWAANGSIKGTNISMTGIGHAATAREAAAMVEEKWFTALERWKPAQDEVNPPATPGPA